MPGSAPQSVGETERAAVSLKRGKLAAGIRDPEERKRFIARQGSEEEREMRGKSSAGMEKLEAETNLEQGRQTAGVDSSDSTRTLRSMKKGGVVRKTGAHLIHRGERVIPADEAEGEGKRPESMHVKKVKGGYHVTHHFKAAKGGAMPETEEHVLPDTSSQHMADHFGGDEEALSE